MSGFQVHGPIWHSAASSCTHGVFNSNIYIHNVIVIFSLSCSMPMVRPFRFLAPCCLLTHRFAPFCSWVSTHVSSSAGLEKHQQMRYQTVIQKVRTIPLFVTAKHCAIMQISVVCNNICLQGLKNSYCLVGSLTFSYQGGHPPGLEPQGCELAKWGHLPGGISASFRVLHSPCLRPS
jgi:hypothetical protein